MIIQLENNISGDRLEKIKNQVLKMGFDHNFVKTQFANYLVGIGKKDIDLRTIGSLEGIEDIHRVSDQFKLVSSKWKLNHTAVDLGTGVQIGNGHFGIMAGPCSIESEEQVIHTVEHLKRNNIQIMRGGVYKPRSSPYSFRGLGIDGLKMFHKHCSANGIKIITEVMQVSQIDDMLEYVDIFQVGARNSQNFNLLDALGNVDKPVLLKRGIAGTIDELLQAAEYIFSNGNEKILLCERGIRTFEKAYRNTLDLNAVAILKDKSHLPVIVDSSHGIGIRKYIEPMTLAGVMTGADGIIIEVHEEPEKAISDGQQSLNFDEADTLYRNVRTMLKAKRQLY
ncbi:MAG: 3-deoxy-7-phosphoheptulonate synthase [Bacteroidales bacterium]|jgi:3-deoxy-7-phosphoheptulonate synthase|nr:3-deoxy-7-phosphoheptulonate synthase [Bacteroidales bacterium]